jgi:hypothetical protein
MRRTFFFQDRDILKNGKEHPGKKNKDEYVTDLFQDVAKLCKKWTIQN